VIETIYRLVYYSHNRMVGSPDANAEAIQSILAASRRNNPKVNVTGALMFNAGCFAQVLEGPREGVEYTFERIQQDERHGGLSLLGFAPTSERGFKRWSMAFVGATLADDVRYGAIAAESGYDPSRMTNEALFETLHRLVLEEETATSLADPIG